MLDIDETELAQIIHPVSFYRNKAKYIKRVAAVLTTQASGAPVVDIPDSFDALLALPGVGPKMAYLVMDAAWNKYDRTHTHAASDNLTQLSLSAVAH